MSMTAKVYLLFLLILQALNCHADKFDPFDPFEQEQFKLEEVSSGGMPPKGSTSLDLAYRVKHTAGLIRNDGLDLTTHQVFGDLGLKYLPTDSSRLIARGVGIWSHDRVSDQSQYDTESELLEGFYEAGHKATGQYLSVGRKYMGWSAGFQWRPADLISNDFVTKDVDVFDPRRYRGVDQIQYEKLGSYVDFSLIASNQDRDFYDGDQFAVKINVRRGAEFSLLLGKIGKYSEKVGAVFDSSLPLDTTLAVEAIYVEIDKERLMYPAYFGTTLESLSQESTYLDLLVVVSHFIDERQRVQLEYFHNGRGFEDEINEEVGKAVAEFARFGYTEVPISGSVFSENYLRENYLSVSYVAFASAFKVEVESRVLAGIDDESYVGSLGLKRAFWGRSELALRFIQYAGSDTSEFGAVTKDIAVEGTLKISVF